MGNSKSSFNKKLFIVMGLMIILVIALILVSVVLVQFKQANKGANTVAQNSNFEKAKEYYYDGYYEIAEERFRKAIKEDPNKGEYYYWLAETLYQLKKDKEVIAAYDKYLSFKPNDIEVLIHVSNICAEENEHRKAINYLDRALKVAPNSEVINNNICWSYAQQKQYQKALPFCQKAISIDPGEDYILDSMGYVLAGLSQLDESIKYYKDAISINPNRAEYHLHIADAYMQKQDKVNALNHYKRYLKLDPKSSQKEEIQKKILELSSSTP